MLICVIVTLNWIIKGCKDRLSSRFTEMSCIKYNVETDATYVGSNGTFIENENQKTQKSHQ